ncbi:MAG TPA: S8 family serine peptidase [Acidimicrobiia bacterium]|nr:S8 family serine peptidase [Acidimicrobiia bacterium]
MRTVRILLAVVLLASMVVTGGAVAGVSESGDGFVPAELIVGLEPGANPWAIADALAAQVDRALLSGDAFVLRIAGNPKAVAAVARVLPGVRYAEPNWIRTLHDHDTDLTMPNDTDFGLKWDLFNGGTLSDGSNEPTHGADINWLDAYNALQGSLTETKIGILDTGIDASHPDLNDKLVPGWDFISNDSTPQDGFGHGTHVAGIAAAETNNSIGTAGVGFAAAIKIMPVKVCDDSGQCPSDAIANGITFAAANGAKVINMSFGGTEISQAEIDAINLADSAGVLIVASAGNSNVATKNYPAAYEPVMAIAATDWNDGKASYSNYGDWVDLAAPGGDMDKYDDPEGIYSTMPTYNVFLTSCRAMGLLSPCYDLNYDQLAGTSMAAPQVAGAAALLFAMGVPATEVRGLLQSTAEAISGTGTLWANGRLDVGAAVAGAGSPPDPGTVSGIVTDASTNSGIVDATVTVVEASLSATTGVDGSYAISVPEGTYTVTASASGYVSESQTGVLVTSGGTIAVNFALNPEPAVTTLHVGDLNGVAVSQGSTWRAEVTILIVDNVGNPVEGATVLGTWTPSGSGGTTSCVTMADGKCMVSSGSIAKRFSNTTWTVGDVTHGTLGYDSNANLETSITISKP